MDHAGHDVVAVWMVERQMSRRMRFCAFQFQEATVDLKMQEFVLVKSPEGCLYTSSQVYASVLLYVKAESSDSSPPDEDAPLPIIPERLVVGEYIDAVPLNLLEHLGCRSFERGRFVALPFGNVPTEELVSWQLNEWLVAVVNFWWCISNLCEQWISSCISF